MELNNESPYPNKIVQHFPVWHYRSFHRSMTSLWSIAIVLHLQNSCLLYILQHFTILQHFSMLRTTISLQDHDSAPHHYFVPITDLYYSSMIQQPPLSSDQLGNKAWPDSRSKVGAIFGSFAAVSTGLGKAAPASFPASMLQCPIATLSLYTRSLSDPLCSTQSVSATELQQRLLHMSMYTRSLWEPIINRPPHQSHTGAEWLSTHHHNFVHIHSLKPRKSTQNNRHECIKMEGIIAHLQLCTCSISWYTTVKIIPGWKTEHSKSNEMKTQKCTEKLHHMKTQKQCEDSKTMRRTIKMSSHEEWT